MKHEPNGVDDCLAHLMFKYRPGDNLDSSWVLSVTPDICLCAIASFEILYSSLFTDDVFGATQFEQVKAMLIKTTT